MTTVERKTRSNPHSADTRKVEEMKHEMCREMLK